MGDAGLVTIGETMALLSTSRVGRLRHADELRLSIGGAESNVAIGVARLGGRACWLGRVGADELGELVLGRIRAEGVDVESAVADPAVPTSLMIKESPIAGATRVTYYRRGGPGARLQPSDVDTEVLARAAVLHLTGITPALSASARETVGHAIDLARTAGVRVSFDLNYRANLWPAAEAGPVLRDLVARSDLVFAGVAEARLLGLTAEADDDLVRDLAALGPATAVLKLGDRGAVALADGALHTVVAVPVPVVDPVGAGDAFVAGFLAETLAGQPIEHRLRTAAACGAFAVAASGDWEGLPTRADLGLLTTAAGEVLR